METIIKDIKIISSDSQRSDIDRIKQIVQNNYELFFYSLSNNTLDISSKEFNFDELFKFIVSLVFNDANIKNMLNDENILSTLYIESLIRSNEDLNGNIIEQNSNISDELLSSLRAYKYFEANGTFDDFIKYLMVKNREVEIINWLQGVARWKTYNYLLHIITTFLKNDDGEIFNQINSLIKICLDNAMRCDKKDTQATNYPQISDDEFDNLVYNFLQYINAPNEWITIYSDLKKHGLIIKEKDSLHDNSMCFQDEDGKYKILISYGNNIRGFCSFIHEFIHYISRQDGLLLEKITLSEFPSIFFEKVAAFFLIQNGYTKEVINQILKDRDNSNYSLSVSFIPLFSDLLKYTDLGVIDKENKVAFYQEQIDLLRETREKLQSILIAANSNTNDSLDLPEININAEKEADNECDTLITAFLKDGLFIINGYQYLLDSYLVDQIITVDKDAISKMIDITNRLKEFNVKEVLELFNIKLYYSETSINKNTQQ